MTDQLCYVNHTCLASAEFVHRSTALVISMDSHNHQASRGILMVALFGGLPLKYFEQEQRKYVKNSEQVNRSYRLALPR